MRGQISIVGAGVGGLATAARLAHDGYQVKVYEKLPRPGGRASLLEDAGFKFDMGPSFVLMPDFFREVFSYCGADLQDYLNLRTLDIHYKIFFPDGEALTVYRDNDRTKAELERIEPGCSRGYDEMMAETGRIYQAVEPLLYKCFTAKSLLDPTLWPLLGKLRVFENCWQLASRHFRTDKLRYAFTFEAMFIGVSPFVAPAFYSIITYADQIQKVAHPMGGMYQIPLALEKLARQFGAEFHYSAEVSGIESRGDRALLRVGGEQAEADRAVINADYAYARRSLLGWPLPKYQYSCSVFLLYLGLKRKVPGLEHHNLWFSSNLRRNLAQIFDSKEMPDDPSFYIHTPTITDPSLAPEGKEIVYVLVPVPNLEGGADITAHEERLRKLVFDKVQKTVGVNLEELIEVEHRFYPKDFIGRYNIEKGATFGLAHTLLQSAFFRPPNVDRRAGNVYFVGASTQPGGGLPVVIASSRVVADLINQR
jgi:phytoene desaturase